MQLSESVDSKITGPDGDVYLTTTGAASGTGSPPAARCKAYLDSYGDHSAILKNHVQTVESYYAQEWNKGWAFDDVNLFIEFGTAQLLGLLAAMRDEIDTTYTYQLALATGESLSIGPVSIDRIAPETRRRVGPAGAVIIVPGISIIGHGLHSA